MEKKQAKEEGLDCRVVGQKTRDLLRQRALALQPPWGRGLKFCDPQVKMHDPWSFLLPNGSHNLTSHHDMSPNQAATE